MSQPLVDDVVASDPEWSKLAAIPGLTEPWNDVRDKWRLATEEFKVRSIKVFRYPLDLYVHVGGPDQVQTAPQHTIARHFISVQQNHPENPMLCFLIYPTQLVILETFGRKKAEAAEFRGALPVSALCIGLGGGSLPTSAAPCTSILKGQAI